MRVSVLQLSSPPVRLYLTFRHDHHRSLVEQGMEEGERVERGWRRAKEGDNGGRGRQTPEEGVRP